MRRGLLLLALLIGCSSSTPSTPDSGTPLGPQPDTTITSAPAADSNHTVATFGFSSTVAGSRFLCTLDAQAEQPCATSFSVSVTDGQHSLAVRAVSPDGQQDPTPATAQWTVDTVPPVASITSPAALVGPAVSIAFSSNESGRFECSLDGATYASCASPVALSALSDGQHSFLVRPFDAAGNLGTPVSATFTVDATPPDTVISSGVSGTVNTPEVSFMIVSTEPGSTFLCAVDQGGPPTPCPASVSPLTLDFPIDGIGIHLEGRHFIYVWAVDAVGNVDPTPAYAEFVIDVTPPDTSITAGESGTVNSSSASFTFTATENATFQCSLDGAAFSACTSPASYSLLIDGPHTFAVKAIDAGGNVDASPATNSWTISTPAPTTSITAHPSDPTKATSASFSFTSTKQGTFQCALDSASLASCTSPTSYSGLTEGPHTFHVIATDQAGNPDPNPPSFTWTVDLTPPDTSISSSPNSPTNSQSAILVFASTESGSTFSCTLDGATAACTSPKTYNGLGAGVHHFSVAATDAAGNVDTTPAQASWTIDLTPPDTNITGQPGTNTQSQSATFSFSSTKPNSTFQCTLDGTSAACTSPITYPGLSEATHTFSVVATDAVGNVDPSPASVTWTVDLTPPDTTITGGPSNSTSSTSATFSFTSTEGGTFMCSLDGATAASCTSPKTYSGLSVADHTFSVYAVDLAQNADASPATASWTVVPSTDVRIRLMAANLSSGNHQSYDDPANGGCTASGYALGEGARLIESMKPDIVMIQEFNYYGPTCSNTTGNGDAEISGFVSSLGSVVGVTYNWYREPRTGTVTIPNGVISRYPIVSSGQWDDSTVPDRNYTYAEIAIPGPNHLWAISVHMHTSPTSDHGVEANEILNYIKTGGPGGTRLIPLSDYVVIGGDFNSSSQTTDPAIINLSSDFATAGPFPADQLGDHTTNSTRAKPEDYVLASKNLDPFKTAVVIGSETFNDGLVLDTNVWNNLGQLGDIPPALATDSHANSEQHMGIVRDFLVPQ